VTVGMGVAGVGLATTAGTMVAWGCAPHAARRKAIESRATSRAVIPRRPQMQARNAQSLRRGATGQSKKLGHGTGRICVITNLVWHSNASVP
jgi:hypothetical protein